MRLKSDIFVAALIRRVFGLGGFAAVEKKGAEAAGAIFIRQRFRDGLETLYGPAPQSMFADDDAGEGGGRKFEARAQRASPDAVGDMLARELRFDADLWLVELEIDDVAGLFEVIRPAV